MGQRAPSACLLRKQIVYNLIWTILHREPTALLDSLHEHTVGRFKLDPKWNRTQDHSVKKKLVCLKQISLHYKTLRTETVRAWTFELVSTFCCIMWMFIRDPADSNPAKSDNAVESPPPSTV